MSSIPSNYISDIPSTHNYTTPIYITNFPGITNLFTAPIGIIIGIKDLISSIHLKDYDSKKNAILYITSCFLAFINAAKATFGLINQFIHNFVPVQLVKQLVGLSAIFLCLIEISIELNGLINQSIFQSKFLSNKDLPLLKGTTNSAITEFIEESRKIIEKLDLDHKEVLSKRLLDLEKSKNICECNKFEKTLEASFYLRNFKKLEEKYFLKPDNFDECLIKSREKSLKKRIRPLFNELKEIINNNDLSSVINDSNFSIDELETKIESSKKIFEKMNSQSKKAICIHLVALASIGITVAAIVTSFFTLPMAIPFTLSAVSYIASIFTFVLQKGLLPIEGNSIKFSEFIPDFISKKFA